ncbi:hypothetical protein NM22_08350 [Vibrio tubiashii]|nr:hypothetical protein NM22_08350 [Vibrio tubiashii]
MISTVVIAVFLVAGVALFLTTIGFYRKRAYIARQSQGLTLLKEFRVLLTLTQQHRGLTNGLLKGDKLLMRQIRPVQGQVNQAIASLELEQWIAKNAEWQDIKHRWEQICLDHEVMHPELSLKRHTALIRCILFLVDDCAEFYRLYEIEHGEQGSIRYLWQGILVTAEHIGQARAIGTGVAAAQECSSVDRIRLNYLNQAIGQVDYLENNKTLDELKATIEAKILVDSERISPSDYFGLATAAIETLLISFDKTLDDTHKNLAG